MSILRSGVLQALAALWAGAVWAQLVISESPSAAERPFASLADAAETRSERRPNRRAKAYLLPAR